MLQINGGKPLKLRRLQPLVEYFEIAVFQGNEPFDIIPTNQFAERLDKTPFDSAVFRSGI